jgi:hypothetical protein
MLRVQQKRAKVLNLLGDKMKYNASIASDGV